MRTLVIDSQDKLEALQHTARLDEMLGRALGELARVKTTNTALWCAVWVFGGCAGVLAVALVQLVSR